LALAVRYATSTTSLNCSGLVKSANKSAALAASFSATHCVSLHASRRKLNDLPIINILRVKSLVMYTGIFRTSIWYRLNHNSSVSISPPSSRTKNSQYGSSSSPATTHCLRIALYGLAACANNVCATCRTIGDPFNVNAYIFDNIIPPSCSPPASPSSPIASKIDPIILNRLIASCNSTYNRLNVNPRKLCPGTSSLAVSACRSSSRAANSLTCFNSSAKPRLKLCCTNPGFRVSIYPDILCTSSPTSNNRSSKCSVGLHTST
ncbi:hypothetical protein AX774_g4853, partial [Zancudomyces culisetae]